MAKENDFPAQLKAYQENTVKQRSLFRENTQKARGNLIHT